MLGLVDRWSAAFAVDLLHAVAPGAPPAPQSCHSVVKRTLATYLATAGPSIAAACSRGGVCVPRIFPRSILIGWEARFFALHIGDGRVLRVPRPGGQLRAGYVASPADGVVDAAPTGCRFRRRLFGIRRGSLYFLVREPEGRGDVQCVGGGGLPG